MSANSRTPPSSLSHLPVMSALPSSASFRENPFTSSRVCITGSSSTWFRCTFPVIIPLNFTAWNSIISMMYCRLIFFRSTMQESVSSLPIFPLALRCWSACSKRKLFTSILFFSTIISAGWIRHTISFKIIWLGCMSIVVCSCFFSSDCLKWAKASTFPLNVVLVLFPQFIVVRSLSSLALAVNARFTMAPFFILLFALTWHWSISSLFSHKSTPDS